MRGGTPVEMDGGKNARDTNRKTHTWIVVPTERDQALPHEAPESNPSQKTKKGEGGGRKKSERKQTEPESATDKRQ